MGQPLLFDVGGERDDGVSATRMPPHNDTPTSVEAAESMLPVAGTLRRRVYDFICEQGTATNSEIERSLHMHLPTVCGRVNELQHSGHIRDSGQRRRTPTGRNAVAWEPTKKKGGCRE